MYCILDAVLVSLPVVQYQILHSGHPFQASTAEIIFCVPRKEVLLAVVSKSQMVDVPDVHPGNNSPLILDQLLNRHRSILLE